MNELEAKIRSYREEVLDCKERYETRYGSFFRSRLQLSQKKLHRRRWIWLYYLE